MCKGAFYNQIVEERYGAKITAFTGNAEAKQPTQKCIAWVCDDSSIFGRPQFRNWDEFEMPLNSEDDKPWALAVPLKERNCVFDASCQACRLWHQDGSLIELEKEAATQYLVNYNDA